ncbi:uncharacterized protein LOC101741380 isoform X2 [Bombyx mori]|uniref:Uncharacterized protein n=1 Tax=Bombyx mori TaxID=7091 RepID=A0A8R2AS03_BOMMO|nr:uncharacterized protein LOC101741380 isoform X1 [Bombyx mori]
MENRSFDVEDILDLTDTEDTSSSSSNIGVYDNRTPLVMDIHEVKKDDPIAENSSPETKIKKLKKKKKVKQVTDKMEPSISSESAAEVNSLVAAVEEGAKEEFFDAHESYHVIPDNQIENSEAQVILALAASEHQQGPKTTTQQTSSTQPPSANLTESDKKPSIISKPVTRHD